MLADITSNFYGYFLLRNEWNSFSSVTKFGEDILLKKTLDYP